ncbi:hypothetical protein MMC21_006032 [Puttea exsequens]|nr:hypothetical protein [Puttea exsequens]
MSSFVPTSISAVESNNLSILYYTRTNGQLASLTAQKVGEANKNPDYKSANVMLGGNTVQTSGAPQIRLYYIGGSENGGFRLFELCQTNGGEWRDGALNENLINITKDSLISANVEDGVSDVKVFYNRKDDNGNTRPAVAWVVKGQESWSSKFIGHWQSSTSSYHIKYTVHSLTSLTLLFTALLPTSATATKSMMAATTPWTITSSNRTCSPPNKSYSSTFGIDTHNSSSTTSAYTIAAPAPASDSTYTSQVCGAFKVGGT